MKKILLFVVRVKDFSVEILLLTVILYLSTSNISAKEIALTFDDGPSASGTEQILKILKVEKVPATFFEVGENVEKFPEISKKVSDAGFTIGNHSYDHSSKLRQMSENSFNSELVKTQEVIEKATGKKPHWFRPPYGVTSKSMRKIAYKNNLQQVFWSIDTLDWGRSASTSTIIQNLKNGLEKNGRVILMHDGKAGSKSYHPVTIEALPIVLKYLKDNNYMIVPLEKMVLSEPYIK